MQKNTSKKFLQNAMKQQATKVAKIKREEAEKRAKTASDPTSKLEQMTISDVSTKDPDSWDVPGSTEIAKPVLTENLQTQASNDQPKTEEHPEPKEVEEKDIEWNTTKLSDEAQEKAQFENWIPPSLRRPEDEFYDVK